MPMHCGELRLQESLSRPEAGVGPTGPAEEPAASRGPQLRLSLVQCNHVPHQVHAALLCLPLFLVLLPSSIWAQRCIQPICSDHGEEALSCQNQGAPLVGGVMAHEYVSGGVLV